MTPLPTAYDFDTTNIIKGGVAGRVRSPGLCIYPPRSTDSKTFGKRQTAAIERVADGRVTSVLRDAVAACEREAPATRGLPGKA